MLCPQLPSQNWESGSGIKLRTLGNGIDSVTTRLDAYSRELVSYMGDRNPAL